MVFFQLFSGVLQLEPHLGCSIGSDAAAVVVRDLTCEILARLPPQFDLSQTEIKHPIMYSQSLNTVLRQVSFYNSLISVVFTYILCVMFCINTCFLLT